MASNHSEEEINSSSNINEEGEVEMVEATQDEVRNYAMTSRVRKDANLEADEEVASTAGPICVRNRRTPHR